MNASQKAAEVLSTEAALASEALIFGTVQPASAAPAKWMLGKRLAAGLCTHALQPIETDEDWQRYLRHRIEIERGFGIDAEAARAMVETMRDRQHSLPIRWAFLMRGADAVGAVGLLRFEHADQVCGRLQDVDIFLAFRSQGLGNTLLDAVQAWARAEPTPATQLFVAADEDDWPLAWYERHGFTRLARVGKQPG
ncbi:hypothetical protein IP84_14205 [beta proteobacterium AAP99]|nr:hypothetical protein IP84_14205 [beta proteobacterium AAP99]